MERFVSNRVEVVDGLSHHLSDPVFQDMIHCKALNVVLFQIDPLIRVDVANTQQDDVFKGNSILEPRKARNQVLRQPTSMSCWVTVVSWISTIAGIYEVRVGIDPDDFEILEMSIQTMKSGTTNRMVSSDSDHHTILVSLHCVHNGIVDFPQKTIKQRQVFDEMFFLFKILNLSIKILLVNIAKVDNIDIKFSFEALEQSAFSQQIWSLFDAFYLLSLPDAGPEVAQSLGRCLFDFVHRLQLSANRFIYHSHQIFKIFMKNLVIVIAVLFVAATAIFQSPRQWLERGFDVTDGLLEDFTGYDVKLDTSCKDIVLNIQGTPYNYNGTVMSGYLKVNKGDSALTFIFYGKQNTAGTDLKNIPTVLWLNGGPGSSSQLGNLMELGPFRIAQSAEKPFDIVRNQWAWTKNYNVLFVDQPVGTGLSYADPKYPKAYVTNMTELANDFYEALKELYNNPNGCFQKLGIKGDSPLFVFGESYGGKYAPAIGEKILREARDNKGFLTGLKGVAIGDGFTNPFSTLSMMGEYAYNLGLLDYQDRSRVEQYLLNASYQQINYRYNDLHVSFYKVLQTITNSSWGVNVYDITKYRPYPTSLLQTYFASQDVLNMYQLDASIKYNSQGGNVHEALYEDFMKKEVSLVENILLNYQVKMLIYTGQNDLICNTPGTLRWVEGLRFADGDKFRDTLLTPWKINNEVKGFMKRVGKLELRTINDGGHLIPMDQGEVALNMVIDFIQNALAVPEQQQNQEPTPTNIIIDQ